MVDFCINETSKSRKAYKVSEALTRLVAVLALDLDRAELAEKLEADRFEKLEKTMLEYESCEDEGYVSLRSINARKFRHNLDVGSGTGIKFGDHLLPMNDLCYENKEAKKTIMFVQGIESHPLRTWQLASNQYKIRSKS